ncbi:hypothetical protein INR49_020491 [Caranx melampygus]|nr:hypothetical protein INR49_020491 [Caranx melampygus]
MKLSLHDTETGTDTATGRQEPGGRQALRSGPVGLTGVETRRGGPCVLWELVLMSANEDPRVQQRKHLDTTETEVNAAEGGALGSEVVCIRKHSREVCSSGLHMCCRASPSSQAPEWNISHHVPHIRVMTFDTTMVDTTRLLDSHGFNKKKKKTNDCEGALLQTPAGENCRIQQQRPDHQLPTVKVDIKIRQCPVQGDRDITHDAT